MEKMSIEGREGGIWSKSVPESTRPRKIINKNEKGIVNRGIHNTCILQETYLQSMGRLIPSFEEHSEFHP
ncbi:hypothetical protein YC2023_045657 [Brassica napus]